MKRTRLLKFVLTSLAETTWRRVRGEPVYESWPFRFEWLWGVMRKSFQAGRGVEPQRIRAAQEEMAREPEYPVERRRLEVGGVDCEWFLPEGGEAAVPAGGPAVVYLHGGGYFFGSTNTHADFLSRLVRRAELPVLGVNYRLCPEYGVDDARDDVVAVFEGLVERGFKPEELALGGDSAGGGLAVSTAVALRDGGGPMPAGLALISPWVDMHCASDAHVANSDTDYMTGEMVERVAELVLDGRAAEDPLVSPLFADHRGLPPTLIHAGGAEVLVEDCRRLAERMEGAGVEVDLKVWPEMVHVFHNFAGVLPRASEALDEYAGFLKSTAA